MLLGLFIGIATPSGLSCQQMDGGIPGTHFQAQVEMVLGFIQGVTIPGPLGGDEVVLRPAKDRRSPNPQDA
jgi:hypothetical protein